MDRLLADTMPLAIGRSRVNFWSTALAQHRPRNLYILYRIVKSDCDKAGATIVMPRCRTLRKSHEMSGVNPLHLCTCDEFGSPFEAPADCLSAGGSDEQLAKAEFRYVASTV